jgi:hypothetical protein
VSKSQYIQYLMDEWNRHEARHLEMEFGPEQHNPELARFLVAAKAKAARALLEAGYVNAGYIDRENEKRCVWSYDPEEARELVAIANAKDVNSYLNAPVPSN